VAVESSARATAFMPNCSAVGILNIRFYVSLYGLTQATQVLRHFEATDEARNKQQ